MAHDALEQSLSEHGPSLERQVKDLTAILTHLLSCIEEVRDEAAANRAKIDRCMANSAAATTIASQARENAREAPEEARKAAHEELLKIAEEARKAAHEEPKRKRRLPPGWGGVVAGAAIALGLLKAHRVAAAAGAVALTAATAAPIAGVMLPDADAPRVAVVAHHHAHSRRGPLDPVTAAVPPRRRHRQTLAHSARKKARPSPKASAVPTAAPSPPPSPEPSPDPSPTTGAPTPSPGPTVTGTPIPGPSTAPTTGPATGLLLKPLTQWDH